MDEDSLDDILEEERQSKLDYSLHQTPLPEDNDRPAAPADDISDDMKEFPRDENHPSQDVNVDESERYDQG